MTPKRKPKTKPMKAVKGYAQVQNYKMHTVHIPETLEGKKALENIVGTYKGDGIIRVLISPLTK